MKKRFFLLACFLTLFSCFFQKAAIASDVPPIVNPLKGSLNQLVKGSTNYIDLTASVDTSKVVMPVNRVTNIISFYLNEDTTMFLSSNFIAKVKYHLYYKNAAGTLDSLKDQWLEINYRGVTGDSAYEQRKSFYFYNAHYTQIVVDSFYTNVAWNVKPALILMNEMRVNLDYKFACTVNSIDSLRPNQQYTQDDELYVYWTKPEGADEYDFEWAYIDSSALDNYKTSGNFDPLLIFDNNATRVTVDDSLAYRIPLLYDGGGILFYRVRPVQNKLNGKRIEGKWSTGGSNTWYYSFAGHQLPLNWQASTSFAEEGKRKSVVQYFDGTLRSRQTVTKDNTSQQTVVAETFYDHQGRPVIQVLPAPTLNTIISYTQNFNRMNTGEYDKSRYDTLLNPSSYCNTSADTMSVLGGASQYYSASNPQKNTSFNKFIPDAAGYPFTETQYTQDNTGRISKQSGVGPDHKLGSGHETKYYYGAASQQEIDAIFGTEVGNYSHYFKNMVRDANGQYSVSYVDMKGRTIATALAGKLPDSIKLDTLASYYTATITEKLTDSSSNTIKGLTMEASKGLIVTKAGMHQFQYSLLPDSVSIKDCNNLNICYDCYYDLEVTISGDCNNEQFSGNTVVLKRTNFTIPVPDTTCNSLINFPGIDTSLYLTEGSYLITKKLTISRAASEYYRDSVFLSTNLCKTKEQFIQEQIDSMRLQSTCEITCETCEETTGNWETFRHNYMLESGYLFSDTASHRGEAWADFQEAIAICKEICGKKGLIDDIRYAMLTDVTPPGGQYANKDSIDIYSVFQKSPVIIGDRKYTKVLGYTDENGKLDSVLNDNGVLVPPTALTIDEFVNNFKTVWADSLLQFHPEYCFLNYAAQHAASYEWDEQFLNTETFAEAKAKGFLNPSGVSGVSGFKYNTTTVTDPLMSSSAVLPHPQTQVLTPVKQLINSKLVNYTFDENTDDSVTVWSIASFIGKCKDKDASCAATMMNVANAFDTTVLCGGELDMAWRAFREIYYKAKQQILYDLQVYNCGSAPSLGNYVVRFVDPSSRDNNLPFTSASDSTAAKQFVKNSLYTEYNDNCTAYAEQWLLQLAQCPLYDTANLRTEVLPHLINVCVKGSDTWHPFGSSSISPDSSYTFNSFQDVIRWYNTNHSITDSIACNVYAITNPPAYGQQSSFADKPIWNKPDSCDCARITDLKAKYTSNQSAYSSFSDYMLKKQGTIISNATLDSLVNLCDGTITCNFLSSPLTLPPSMQCGVKDVCADCITVDSVYSNFKINYPDVVPLYQDSQDTLQQTKNQLFAAYMNNKLGFNFTHTDYLGFIDACKGYGTGSITYDTSTVSCSELRNFQAGYHYQYIQPDSGFVDYELRTIAGNVVSDEGPKGVFDVNGNLIGNTTGGTATQIKNSYVSVWNSSSVNNTVGTLSLLENGKFRLTLNSGQSAPCNGIIGMRFYQFDFKSDTLNAINISEGTYIDFGDGEKGIIPLKANTWPTPKTYVAILNGLSTGRLTPDLIRPAGAWIHHFYPDTSLKTVTVYHTDLGGRVGFDSWDIGINAGPYKLRYASNIRGNFPQQLIELSVFSTRDSTLNSFSQITNFSQISSLGRIMFSNSAPSNPVTALENVKFETFSASPKLNHIRFIQGNASAPATKYVEFHKVFPNMPVNFPRISQLEMYEYANEINEDSISFRLPNLVYLDFKSVNVTNTQIDSILIQIANGSLRDTGRLFIQAFNGANRTSASDNAVTTLYNKRWDILINGSWVQYFGNGFASTGYTLDTIPYTNKFTDLFNQSFGTQLSFHQIENFYKNKCGKSLNLCSLPLRLDTVLCGKSEPIFKAITDIQSPCADSTELGIIKGTILYEAYRDSIKNSFEEKYLAKCLQAYKYESFTVTRPVSEFHYTLYYYDQAGNLVKTVPPAGVQPIYRQSWLDSVANFRTAKTQLTPLHTLYTTYRYNTLNQVVGQRTPDAGISRFWYDRLGRLAVSQNAKQFAQATKQYSYTIYDALGRIIEVGQKPQTTAMTTTISRDSTALKNWLNAAGTKEQITKTAYDIAVANTAVNANIVQRNLRNRVAYTSFWNVANNPDWNSAVFYSYDIHGNVDTLLNDYGSSSYTQTQNPMNLRGHRWKKLVYRYDLISGKVNHVAYQPRQRDAIYHRYNYDAENRLVMAEISTDSLYWERDAKYEYYRHGPLARTVLGHQNIQGLDYAYTLQGWLKGVNGTVMNPAYDMGLDGNNTTAVARDTFGFSLYYHGNDYTAINDANRFAGLKAKLVTAGVHKPLFNGNISAMAVNIGVLNKPVLYNYTYDQLNRITAMDVFNGTNNSGANLWSGTITATNEYKERISYDANGNILRYLRQGTGSKLDMDSLSYKYNTGTNQLNWVKDNVGNNEYRSSNSAPYDIEDINNQSSNNYTYDQIGNLVSDAAENITTAAGGIKWNVYGKITEINKATSGNGSVKKITYTYDASGNRISKKVERYNSGGTDYTFYIRDASGNTMSVYTYTDSLRVSEQYMYGRSRLGNIAPALNLDRAAPAPVSMPLLTAGNIATFTRGNKFFELSNNLGNVLVVLSDKKKGVQHGSTGTALYYLPIVKSAQDFYPFGMQMPGRIFNSASYAFGFNGKRKDNEIKGEGNSYDFGARINDPRLGRWLSSDPLFKEYSYQGTYNSMSNNPINRIDPNGMGDYYDKDGKKIGSDGKTVTVGKGKNAKQVTDDKAYVTTQENINQNTKNGITDWDKVIAASGTSLLGISNSTLNIFANTVAEESSGNKEESYGIASTIKNLMQLKRKDLLTTLQTEGIYGYDNGGNSSNYRNNAEYSMGAAINALSGGIDYSNGAIRWDGDDFGKKGFSHSKPTFMGIEILPAHFAAYKKAYSAVYSNFSSNLSTEVHTATSNAWNNKGRCLLISTAVHGRTIFWGANRDPIILIRESPPMSAPYEFLINFNPKVIGEKHPNKGYKTWSSL